MADTQRPTAGTVRILSIPRGAAQVGRTSAQLVIHLPKALQLRFIDTYLLVTYPVTWRNRVTRHTATVSGCGWRISRIGSRGSGLQLR